MSGLSSEDTGLLRHNQGKHNEFGAKINGEVYRSKSVMSEVDSILKECEEGQAGRKKGHRRRPVASHVKKNKDNQVARKPAIQTEDTGGELTQEIIDDWLNMFKPVEPTREMSQQQSSGQSKSSKKKKKKRPPHDRAEIADEVFPTEVEHNYDIAFRPASKPQISLGAAQDFNIKITRHRKRRDARRVTTFFILPRELRDMVYELCIPNLGGITMNVKNQLLGYYDGMARINQMRQHNKVRHLIQRLVMRHGQLQTPNVLLLNRQIYEEAILYLKKQTITFDFPAIVCDDFPISQLVSPGLLRTVRELHLEMPMKQHSHATMLGEMQMGFNWYAKSSTNYESLEHAQPWGFFLMSIASILQDPGHHVQHVAFAITNGISGRKDYTLDPDPYNMAELAKTVQACLRSRNLDKFLRFLQLAAISYTEHPNINDTTSNDDKVSGDASNH